MLGYGSPPSAQSLPKLVMTRFFGSHPGNVLTNVLEKPIGEVRNSLLAELNLILEGNYLVNKDFRSNRVVYWRYKKENDDRLEVNLRFKIISDYLNIFSDFLKIRS